MGWGRGTGWALAMALVAAPGCVGEGEPEVDTNPATTSLEPHVFWVGGSFGWDAEAEQAVPYTIEGALRPVTLEIEIASADYFLTGDADHLCHATLSTEAPLAPSERADAAGLHLGIDLPAGASLDHDCHLVPASVWGSADAVFGAWSWGLGVGPLDEAVAAELETTVAGSGGDWETEWVPWVVGGSACWELLEPHYPGGYAPTGYTIAYGTDADMVVLDVEGAPYDGTADVSLLRAEDLAAVPPRGAYVVRPYLGFDASYLLPAR